MLTRFRDAHPKRYSCGYNISLVQLQQSASTTTSAEREANVPWDDPQLHAWKRLIQRSLETWKKSDEA